SPNNARCASNIWRGEYMIDRSIPLRALFAFACLSGGLTNACSKQQSSQPALNVGAAYDALAGKLHDCGHQFDACRDASDCSAAAIADCEDQRHICEQAAQAAEEALHAATRACRVAEETCEASAADAGPDARKACHDQAHTCMDALKPPEPPCHAALEKCLDEARAV